MLKLVTFALLATAAHCGVIAPAATSHSSLISHSAPLAYSSPLGYSSPVSYAAPRLAAAPLAVAHAPLAVAHAPVAIAKQVVAEPYAPPHYDFNYAVHDPHTGDVHEQQESRVNDVVQGSYSLVEPDGSRRIVHYSADDHNGFQAVVQREPATHPVQVAPVVRAVAPIVRHVAPVARLAAPAYASYASPALVNHVTHY